MTLVPLAIPDPSEILPADFADRARRWLAEQTDIAAVDDVRRRLTALETYVKGRESKLVAQTAARWSEARIGELLGEREVGGRGKKVPSAFGSLSEDERRWFRRLAEHLDVLAELLGQAKASRSAILNEIRRRTMPRPPKPQGVYRCIVIDPPWPMAKIERHERPHQDDELDYPTMSLGEITALPVDELADPDGCHLYLWVTHKQLPAGLDLLDAWGFRYQCVMTWRKNVGITPFSWMYDTEHVLFARKGSLELLQRGLRLSFEAPVQGHSIKPDVFYDRVRAASPGARLDMFPGIPHHDFEPWGLEGSHRAAG